MRDFAMIRIPTKVWSHASVASGEKFYVSDVVGSRPQDVATFQELVRLVAEVGFHNASYVLYFRGQTKDYQKSLKEKGQVSSFYPSIYRTMAGSLVTTEVERRFTELEYFAGALRSEFAKQELAGHERMSKFPELAWAVLQHYGVCDTPLLDVTHSLRVACSFALSKVGEDGYLYVFGFPHPNGSISYSVDLELITIRLLSACPPQAHRPHFQEGFLVGTFPPKRTLKRASLDVGVRLIAKYKLHQETFWDDHFHAIPHQALFPVSDMVKETCEVLRKEGSPTHSAPV